MIRFVLCAALVLLSVPGFVFCATLVLLSVPAVAQQQPSQPDPKYILAPLQAQRDSNANAAVICEASSAVLKERIAELEAKLKEATAQDSKQ